MIKCAECRAYSAYITAYGNDIRKYPSTASYSLLLGSESESKIWNTSGQYGLSLDLYLRGWFLSVTSTSYTRANAELRLVSMTLNSTLEFCLQLDARAVYDIC
jgi:hypothetical protein